MTWVFFYTYPSGKQVYEPCDTWTEAFATLEGYLEMINPSETEVTFKREIGNAKPDQIYLITDGAHIFAIETMS